MDISALSKYEVYENEICTILENTGDNQPSTVKVHIVNVMPLIPQDGKTSTGKIDRKIFLNDDTCKPSMSSSVNLQNFINIRAFKNVNTSHLEKGTRYICMAIMKSLSDIFLTDKMLP